MKSKRLFGSILTAVASFALLSSPALAEDKTPAFKVGKKVKSIGELAKEDQAAFYELEKKKYEQVVNMAEAAYWDYHWEKEAKKKGVSATAAREAYLKAKIKISAKAVATTLERFKDHPQLSKLPKKEQERQVREYLRDRDTKELLQDILETASKKGELQILYPEPEEPLYKLMVNKDDHVRYGPKDTDVKPLGCKGDDCAITVIEYSEFQCPFCSRVIPDIKRVLKEYQGKIRWVVRDFPLNFHDRAKPAARAAKCAGFQGKYWPMYAILFENQGALSDKDLASYGTKIGLKKDEYTKCLKGSEKADALIEQNFASGAKVGVTGTPAFFINGRRLSGALPFSEFKRVIDKELARQKTAKGMKKKKKA